MNRGALVLAAHGSDTEPSVNAAIRDWAAQLEVRGGFETVIAAFHRGSPTFATALDELGADDVTVVPVMTSRGYYCDWFLPRKLAENARYKRVRLRITDPVGTHPGLAGVMMRRVVGLARALAIDPDRMTLAVVGHGTARHLQSRRATVELVDTLRRAAICPQVIEAFLDEEPGVESIVARSDGDAIAVIPFLISAGAHATRDLPAALVAQGDGRPIVCDRPIGCDPGILDVIAGLAGGMNQVRRDRFHSRAISRCMYGREVH